MKRKTTTLWQRRVTTTLAGAFVLLVLTSSGVHAEEEPDYSQLTVTANATYMLVGMLQLNAEWAATSNWSLALRGGIGESDLSGEDLTIMEFGAQTSYYVTGHASRGTQLGFDARVVSYEGDGMLMGIGDGVAVGPYVGYKHTFGRGFTLGAQLGAQIALAGKSDGRVFPYLSLSAGWAFMPVLSADQNVSSSPPGSQPACASTNPFDYHDGFTFGVAMAGGTAVIDGCDDCELEPGLAFAAYAGWFVHPRVALVLDSSATVALLSLSSGFGSFAVGLTGPALQYWPHPDVWLKAGIGVAQLTSVGIGGAGVNADTGGGGTLAVGYQVHHKRGFGVDVQLRASHGSFDGNDNLTGVDSFVALVGLNWF